MEKPAPVVSGEEKPSKKASLLDKMYDDLFPDVMAPSGPQLTIKTPDNPDLRFSRPKPEPKPARDLRFRPEPPKTSGPPIRDLWPPKK